MLIAGAAQADVIINIDATANGENTGGADCSVACEGSLINPVQVTFGPGSYEITDAWSATSGLEPGALFDASNFEAGNPTAWAWHWKMLLDDGSDGSTISPTNYSSFILADVDAAFPADAFSSESVAANFGYDTAPTDFVVNDYDLNDNAGGVPEPSSSALLLGALTAFGALRRRKRA